MATLVTGGAGYIGSHMVRALAQRGERVVVIDDFSSGHCDAIAPAVPILEADVGDATRVVPFLRRHGVDEILHFASRIQVGESVVDPRLHYEGNLGAAIGLLGAALACGVRRFVFSSSAAVYGAPRELPIPEHHATEPVSPYGETKLAIERMLASYGRAYGVRWTALRYFNAAGAAQGLGERHHPETHLVPLVLQAALHGTPVTIFGRDYPTRDGTCVRDYIHVLDLVDAHVAALEHLREDGECCALNLGTGRGYTVAEVVETCRRITGRRIEARVGDRRPGDPPELVARVDRAREVLGWTATRSDLDTIVRDAWRFHSQPRTNSLSETA